MTFLNSPKKYLVELPGMRGGLAVFESVKRAVCAIIVRKTIKQPWSVYDGYESRTIAEAQVTPVYRLADHEMSPLQKREADEKAERPTEEYQSFKIVNIIGFVHPVMWHGREQAEAVEAGKIPAPLDYPASLLDEVNSLLTRHDLNKWVVDTSATAPGFYSLMTGEPGELTPDAGGERAPTVFPKPKWVGTPVIQGAVTLDVLVHFLRGAIAVLDRLPSETDLDKLERARQNDPLHLSDDELNVLQEKLIALAPQHRFRIRQAIKQAFQSTSEDRRQR